MSVARQMDLQPPFASSPSPCLSPHQAQSLRRHRGRQADYLVIYDAEDRLARPAESGGGVRPDAAKVACIQNKLGFWPDRNVLTRCFTAECTAWFGLSLQAGLPACHSLGTPQITSDRCP